MHGSPDRRHRRAKWLKFASAPTLFRVNFERARGEAAVFIQGRRVGRKINLPNQISPTDIKFNGAAV